MKIRMLAVLLVLVVALVSVGGCAKAPEPEAEPIVLGAPVSLGYAVGQDSVKAAQMAIDEINAQGGVLVDGTRRPLKLVAIDSRAMAPGVPVADSLLAYQKLILDEKVWAIALAAERSEVTLAAMDLIAKYKLIHMIPGAKSPAITAKIAEDPEKYKYNFRLAIDVIALLGYIPGHLQAIKGKYGFDTVYFLAEDASFARGMVGVVKNVIESEGWTALGEEYIPLGTTDYSAPLTKLKNSGAQVVYLVFSNPEVGILVEQYATMQIPALAMGSATPLVGPSAWDIYKGKIESLMLNVECGTVPSSLIPESVKFYDAYVDKYGSGPELDSVVASAYDDIYVLAAAIERAGTLDTDAVVEALEATDRTGAIGRIRFDENHQTVYGTDPKESALYSLIQWQSPGKRVVVWPKDAAEGEIQLPPWMR